MLSSVHLNIPVTSTSITRKDAAPDITPHSLAAGLMSVANIAVAIPVHANVSHVKISHKRAAALVRNSESARKMTFLDNIWDRIKGLFGREKKADVLNALYQLLHTGDRTGMDGSLLESDQDTLRWFNTLKDLASSQKDKDLFWIRSFSGGATFYIGKLEICTKLYSPEREITSVSHENISTLSDSSVHPPVVSL